MLKRAKKNIKRAICQEIVFEDFKMTSTTATQLTASQHNLLHVKDPKKFPKSWVEKHETKRNMLKALKNLYKHKPDPTSMDTWLMILLLQNGFDPHLPHAQEVFFSPETHNYVAGSILGMAAKIGDEFAMMLLLKCCKMDPDASDKYGNTALHILALNSIYK
ncbi:hypothetical protein HK098_001849 [Nowakowskiella sp. JEL0407]|nr:hypothetical protein HK098_001849 [Nowakowskiella sp. JEL0407]